MDNTNLIYRDFSRDVWNLFGFPIDNLNMESTKDLLHESKKQADSLVLSTINVNWVVEAIRDPKFFHAIINSDIITLDGKPLVLLSKLLGYPMNDIVAGSSLIQEINKERLLTPPLSIFLFGGDDGVAEQAMKKINCELGGLKAVGAINPGFGSIEEMSDDTIIDTINKTKPDILLVALGAKKGTQWIELNRHRLNAKIISHLGATINFLAGTVIRAPSLINKIGVEWIWRIIQEPKLFTRYAYDGLVLVRLVAKRLFAFLYYIHRKKSLKDNKCQEIIEKHYQKNKIVLTTGKIVQITDYAAVRKLFSSCVKEKKDIVVDFKKTEFVDGAFMGLLSILLKHQRRSGKALDLKNVHGRLSKILALFSHG